MGKKQIQKELYPQRSGFTLVEILVVVIILALAMYAAVPMFSGAAEMRLQSAANMVAADIEYAKSMAISRQQQYGLIFYPDTESYKVVDQNSNEIPHPVKLGFNYNFDFTKDSRLSQVDLVSADFSDGTSTSHTVKFDYLGSPYIGSGGAMNSGTITLQAGGVTATIIIEPVTGYIRIQ